MDIKEAIKLRHSVRQYTKKPLEEQTVALLNNLISECNKESGLNIQLIINEPKAFNCFLANYGKFNNVNNYIAIVGENNKSLYEKIGYYGQKIVLFAQTLGLNSCWVALTYKKNYSKITINKGQKLHIVISIGHGATQGNPRKSKDIFDVCAKKDYPDWFINGIKASLLAPTAVNQQKFYFNLNGNQVNVKSGIGFYSKIDLGIIKYHFEIGAGIENFKWK